MLAREMATRTQTGLNNHLADRSGHDERWMATVPQLSVESGLPKRSIHDLIDRGLLPYVRFPGGRRIWVNKRDLLDLIEKNKEVRA